MTYTSLPSLASTSKTCRASTSARGPSTCTSGSSSSIPRSASTARHANRSVPWRRSSRRTRCPRSGAFVKINYAFPDADVINKLTDEYALELLVRTEPIATGSGGLGRRPGSWVDRVRSPTSQLCERLGMHAVVEETDRFTLIGSQARHGELTLFAEADPGARRAGGDRPARDRPRASAGSARRSRRAL